MKQSKLILSVGYWFGAHSIGLLLHPYLSMRRIVREQMFVSLTYLPLVTLLCWWVIGIIVAQFNVLLTLRLGLVASQLDKITFKPVLWSFMFTWGSVFLILWQVLLGYLYWRFKSVRRDNE